MKNIEQLLNNYYETINEDERLIKDKSHSIEFLTTIKYIEKYLKTGDKILEVGAGTGRYSIYFAQKCFDVDAVELVDSNLSVLKSKITDNMKINAIKGNALDLSMYEDNTFDIVLLLGPLYHLFSKEEKEQAIKEAIRVSKAGGKIFMAYITNDTVILSECLRKGILSKLSEYCDVNDGYRVKENPEKIFSVNYVHEFSELLKNFPATTLHQVATDGIAPNMPIYINQLSDEEFKIWLDYHFATCERKDLLSYSSHILHICEKI